jgi:hypothetical protein
LKKIDLIFKGIIITHTLYSKDLPLTDAEKLVATKIKSDMTYKQMNLIMVIEVMVEVIIIFTRKVDFTNSSFILFSEL